MSNVFWTGFALGCVIGFILALVIVWHFKRQAYKSEEILSWTLAAIWITWHVAAGANVFSITAPPTVFDLVSGGAVGFLLGERFFEYLAAALTSMIKK